MLYETRKIKEELQRNNVWYDVEDICCTIIILGI